jgi:membrane fusion protein, multidrug efflux system
MRLKTDKYGKMSFVTRGRITAALVAAGLALSGCTDQPAALAPVRPVKAMVVPAPVSERVLTYSGVISPRIESTLGFRVAGKIVERLVNTGDRVSAGQAIAKLDEIDLKLAENSARASVVSAKSRVAVAKDAFDRANYLLPNGFIAKAAVDQRQLELDSAKSALAVAEDQLNQAINATSYAILFTDKDGIVTSVRAEPGQVVSAGQAVITHASSNEIEMAAAVPEHEIVHLKPGDDAAIALWPAGSITSAGTIREIAGAADPASRTYGVRISLKYAHPAMRIGMTASVSFKVPQQTPAIVLPLAALAQKNGRTIVFVAVRESETVREREVKTAGVSEEGVRVISGLSPGEVIVTGGVQFLQDGMQVHLAKEVLTAAAEIPGVEQH